MSWEDELDLELDMPEIPTSASRPPAARAEADPFGDWGLASDAPAGAQLAHALDEDLDELLADIGGQPPPSAPSYAPVDVPVRKPAPGSLTQKAPGMSASGMQPAVIGSARAAADEEEGLMRAAEEEEMQGVYHDEPGRGSRGSVARRLLPCGALLFMLGVLASMGDRDAPASTGGQKWSKYQREDGSWDEKGGYFREPENTKELEEAAAALAKKYEEERTRRPYDPARDGPTTTTTREPEYHRGEPMFGAFSVRAEPFRFFRNGSDSSARITTSKRATPLAPGQPAVAGDKVFAPKFTPRSPEGFYTAEFRLDRARAYPLDQTAHRDLRLFYESRSFPFGDAMFAVELFDCHDNMMIHGWTPVLQKYEQMGEETATPNQIVHHMNLRACDESIRDRVGPGRPLDPSVLRDLCPHMLISYDRGARGYKLPDNLAIYAGPRFNRRYLALEIHMLLGWRDALERMETVRRAYHRHWGRFRPHFPLPRVEPNVLSMNLPQGAVDVLDRDALRGREKTFEGNRWYDLDDPTLFQQRRLQTEDGWIDVEAPATTSAGAAPMAVGEHTEGAATTTPAFFGGAGAGGAAAPGAPPAASSTQAATTPLAESSTKAATMSTTAPQQASDDGDPLGATTTSTKTPEQSTQSPEQPRDEDAATATTTSTKTPEQARDEGAAPGATTTSTKTPEQPREEDAPGASPRATTTSTKSPEQPREEDAAKATTTSTKIPEQPREEDAPGASPGATTTSTKIPEQPREGDAPGASPGATTTSTKSPEQQREEDAAKATTTSTKTPEQPREGDAPGASPGATTTSTKSPEQPREEDAAKATTTSTKTPEQPREGDAPGASPGATTSTKIPDGEGAPGDEPDDSEAPAEPADPTTAPTGGTTSTPPPVSAPTSYAATVPFFEDSSGFELHVQRAPTEKRHDFALPVSIVGFILGQELAIQGRMTHVVYESKPSHAALVHKQRLFRSSNNPGEVKIAAIHPHAHATTVRMWVDLIRGDGACRRLLEFNRLGETTLQSFIGIREEHAEKVFNPPDDELASEHVLSQDALDAWYPVDGHADFPKGSKLQVHCVVDARETPVDVTMGTSSFQEMCGPLTLMYPVMPKTNTEESAMLFHQGHTFKGPEVYDPVTMDGRRTECGEWWLGD